MGNNLDIIDLNMVGLAIGFLILVIFLYYSIKIIRPTERGLIERFGKYSRFAEAGIKFLIPVIDRIIKVNITEQMVDIHSQQIITKDNLNATVAAQVYFKVKPTEDNVKNSQYKVDNVKIQIVALAQTTLRNIIGTLTLTDANTKRGRINNDLMKTLAEETQNWGIEVVRTELREIDPPRDVQEAMNNVVKAENEKIAAKDYATAAETKADGERRARIKEAEGQKRAMILDGEGKAKRIELVNMAADKFFVGNAQELKKLEVTENAIKENSVLIVPEGQSLVNVIGDAAGFKILPIEKKIEKDKKK